MVQYVCTYLPVGHYFSALCGSACLYGEQSHVFVGVTFYFSGSHWEKLSHTEAGCPDEYYEHDENIQLRST